ncbi:uncharacterized protein LOC143024329 [Oratosquilla oratoria]|uniref:uncharacterized protein LOC143024329 n=1 Tax=Oratosquilla oratoria TaxID=337810 RepID=UPI003F75F0C8
MDLNEKQDKIPITSSTSQSQSPPTNSWPQQPLDFSTKRSLHEEPVDSITKDDIPLAPPSARKVKNFEDPSRGEVDASRDPQGNSSASSFQEGALNLTRNALPLTISRSSASSGLSMCSGTSKDHPLSVEERATPCCSPEVYPRALHFDSTLPFAAFHVLQARSENIPSPPPMRLSHLTHGHPQHLSKTEATAHLLSQIHANPLLLSTLSSVLAQQQQQQQLKSSRHLQPPFNFWQHGEGPLPPEYPGARTSRNSSPSASGLLVPTEVSAISSSPAPHAFRSFPANGSVSLVAPPGVNGDPGHRLGIGPVIEGANKSVLGRGGLSGVGFEGVLGVGDAANVSRLKGGLVPTREEQVITAESNEAYSKFREQMMTQMHSAKLRRNPSVRSASQSSNSTTTSSSNCDANRGRQVDSASTDEEQENTTERTEPVGTCVSGFDAEVHDFMMNDESGSVRVSSTVGSGTKRRSSPTGTEYDGRKDEAYWERRRKNNEAAKRSRDARRAKEDEIAIRAAFLEQENIKLRVEVASLRSETGKLRCMLCNS